MELVYPYVLYIGIPIVIILIIFRFKKKSKYKNGKKIANTEYTKKLDYYKKVMRKYKIFSFTIKILCIISIICSLFLIARPAEIKTAESKKYNRDIILCLDVSTSVVDLDGHLVSEMKDTVKELKGERFAITIFNTSSNLLVPLTDDYEYVLSILDKLEESLKAYSETSINTETIAKRKYSQSGTLVGNAERGNSIIGEGLASALFDFQNLEEERTRIVILATDNNDASLKEPIVSLEEAGEIAKDKGIIVYALCPELTNNTDKQELKKVVSKTGGELYTETSSNAVSEIVREIKSTQKNELEGTKETKKTDKPEIPLIILTISVLLLFIINKKVKI